MDNTLRFDTGPALSDPPAIFSHWIIRALRDFATDEEIESFTDLTLNRPARVSFEITEPVVASVSWPAAELDFDPALKIRLMDEVSISYLASINGFNREPRAVLMELLAWIEEQKAKHLKGHFHIRLKSELEPPMYYFVGTVGLDGKEPMPDLWEQWWEQIEALDF